MLVDWNVLELLAEKCNQIYGRPVAMISDNILVLLPTDIISGAGFGRIDIPNGAEATCEEDDEQPSIGFRWSDKEVIIMENCLSFTGDYFSIAL